MKQYKLLRGDCLDKLKLMPDNSVDSIVTDPPYGISFMNKVWDYDVPSTLIWKECLRVLKPGGYLLSFAGSRTYHRMAINIEDAGFEIRDQLLWIYSTGFPKSHNVSVSIDKKLGATRNVIGKKSHPTLIDKNKVDRQDSQQYHGKNCIADEWDITESFTEDAKRWDGWGTALKPAHEPIVMARKPIEGSIADSVLKWGVGALNIDACRISADARAEGRFPANLTFSHHKLCVPLDKGKIEYACHKNCAIRKLEDYNDQASKFFYCPKVKRAERNDGLNHCKDVDITNSGNVIGLKSNINTSSGKKRNPNVIVKNNHPTVKPLALMQYLCRLVTPSNKIVLDPFMGSGSTGVAALKENFRFVGIEKEREYYDIATARMEYALSKFNRRRLF